MEFPSSADSASGSSVLLKLSPVPSSTPSVPMRSVVWWVAPPAPSITDLVVSVLWVRGVMILKSY